MYSIYALNDPQANEFFYIGMSVKPHDRYMQHLSLSDNNTAKSKRILALRKEGLRPDLVIIEQDIPYKNSDAREYFWISHYLALGAPLTNIDRTRPPKTKIKAKSPKKGFKLHYSSEQSCPNGDPIATAEELFRRLPISLAELARKSQVSEVTAAKIRDGKVARLHTINKLLIAFSEVYGVPLTIDNVTGFNVLVGRYGDGKLDGITNTDDKKEQSEKAVA